MLVALTIRVGVIRGDEPSRCRFTIALIIYLTYDDLMRITTHIRKDVVVDL